MLVVGVLGLVMGCGVVLFGGLSPDGGGALAGGTAPGWWSG